LIPSVNNSFSEEMVAQIFVCSMINQLQGMTTRTTIFANFEEQVHMNIRRSSEYNSVSPQIRFTIFGAL